jgi:laminin alpha 3/5
LLKGGQLIYGFNCGSGAGWIETEDAYNDGAWHTARFMRSGGRGKLYVDDNLMGEQTLFGDTKNIEVQPEFFLGGIRQQMKEMDVVQKNLEVRKSYICSLN